MSEPNRPRKSFDCVEFKRQAQARIYEEIKDLTSSEEIEYFRRMAENGPFADLIKRMPHLSDPSLETQRSGESQGPCNGMSRKEPTRE
jgi:hypothetical protein